MSENQVEENPNINKENKENIDNKDKEEQQKPESNKSQEKKEPEKTFKYEILSEDHTDFDMSFKLIVIGDSGVGKSCLTNSAVKNVFNDAYNATVGFEFFTFNININGKVVKLQIWDTCGQELYRSLITNFYRNSSLAIIVYAINSKDSFEDIEMWLRELRTHSNPDAKVFLIGNKLDLENERKTQEIFLLNDQMRRLRYELKKEKERSHMALGELNKIYLERSKLENIFIDCVEETRKIIFNRKLKENNGGYKIRQRVGVGKYDYKMNLKTKYESFLPSDKQSILENFVFNDEVSNIIRDAIFTRPKKEKEKLETTKNIIKNLNLYEQNQKGRSSSQKGNHPISGSKKDLSTKLINDRFNEAMKDIGSSGSKSNNEQLNGNQFYNIGRMTMSNFKEHQFGHSSKITVPMQIN